MKTIFMGYSIELTHIDLLKKRIEIVSEAASKCNMLVYAHIRDEQNWQCYTDPGKIVLDKCFEQIRRCDLFLGDFTLYEKKHRTGIHIEAGYAKALGKPIWGILYRGDRPRLLIDLVEKEIAYEKMEELSEIIREAFKLLA